MPGLSADRNLLFGVLAVQTGLIDQPALVSAFRAWSRDKSHPMADLLLGQGTLDEADRALLDGLVTTHLRRHGDDVEKSLAALPAPSTLLSGLAEVGDTEITRSFAAFLPSPGGADTADSSGGAAGDGRRFRVLRPHAQGGLGAVFVAIDGELNREVALKQILDRHADDPHSRTRFLIEAEITGGLEHPGIVPVYGLGRYGDGRPYYAMRFIRGDSLQVAIAGFHGDEGLKRDPGKRSLALRKLLRRFVDVCNAIDYAHGRGVLHRDLKPGNVIVGRHGETLVIDWGLAKALGRPEDGSASDERTLMPSSSSGSADTLPGSALGTPAFMSPEQAIGDLDRLGPRSDVYSLGATLYSLLTGKVPFAKGNLGAVLQAVRKGEFPPPRQLDPTIDRALEAICLKAMALKPEDRHASARALADDIERWTADEPVSAWREPWSRRARRWMRRHRTAVTAASAAVLMAVVGLSSVLAVQSKANRDLKGKNVELADANGRVQARFELAREAIRAFQAGVNEDEMLKGAELEGLRNKLLRSAAGFYERLEKLLAGQTDRASRSILAQSYYELGELIEKIGVRPEALAAQRKALAIRRELAASGADEAAKLDLVRSLLKVGNLAKQTGDPSGARAAVDEALGLAESTAAAFASDGSREMLAKSHRIVGEIQGQQNQTAEAMASFRRALALSEALARGNPGVTRFQDDAAAVRTDIGYVHKSAGRFAEASAEFGAARDGFEALAKANPTDTSSQVGLAQGHANLGGVQKRTGRPDEALASYLRALAIREALVKANPAATEFRADLAQAEATVASLQLDSGRSGDALASYGRSLAIREALARANPAVVRFQEDEATALGELSWMQSRISRWGEALATAEREVKMRANLANTNPSIADFRYGLGNAFINLGQLQFETGDAKAGVISTKLGLATLEKAAKADLTNHRYRVNLAVGHLNLGANLERADPRGSLESNRRALSLFEDLLREDPSVTDHRFGVANASSNVGDIQRTMGLREQAAASYDRALREYETLATTNPTITIFQVRLAAVLITLAKGQQEAGRSGEASATIARARPIVERLVASNPDDPEARLTLAQCLGVSASLGSAGGRYVEAVALNRRAIAILGAIPEDAPALYDLTCCRSRLAELANRPGSGIAAEEGRAEADRAVSAFAKAIELGYSNLAQARSDPDLDPIRARPDFQLLMMDLAFPADPFAQGQ